MSKRGELVVGALSAELTFMAMMLESAHEFTCYGRSSIHEDAHEFWTELLDMLERKLRTYTIAAEILNTVDRFQEEIPSAEYVELVKIMFPSKKRRYN